MTPQERLNEIAEELRKIYKTNEGPRLIHEMTYEFQYPRRIWNDAKYGHRAKYGNLVTQQN